MADPTNPTGAAPAVAQPKVKTEIEKRYDEAGYARNLADLNYKNAVKDHGADSAEAKATKESLTEAQVQVEAIQKEMRGGGKPAPKQEAKAPAPKPETLERKLKVNSEFTRYSEYIEMRPKASEMLIRRDFSKLLNDKAVKDFVECLKKNKDQKDGISPCLDKLDGKKPVLPTPLQQKALTDS